MDLRDVCAVVAGLGGCGGGDPAVTGPPDARLVVIPELTREAMFGRVTGVLSINSRGCFALDERVLVVGQGSRVLGGGKSIDVADVGIVDLGARTSGGGGYIDGLEEVEHFTQGSSLHDEVMKCLPPGGDASLAVLDPATP